MLECGPVRHQIGVGDEHPRRLFVGLEDSYRFAGLDEQGLVGFKRFQRSDDPVETVPVARGPANTTIHNQFCGILGNRRIKVVHEHPHRRFGAPVFTLQFGPLGRFDMSFRCVSVQCHFDKLL